MVNTKRSVTKKSSQSITDDHEVYQARGFEQKQKSKGSKWLKQTGLIKNRIEEGRGIEEYGLIYIAEW